MATDRFPPIQGFIRLWHLTTIVSRQGQGFIPWAMSHTFPLTNLCHTLLSCTILLACPTSKPLFFKHSFIVSIHLFPSLSLRDYQHLLSNPAILTTWPNHWKTPSTTPFINLHNYLIHAFRTLPILLTPSRPLRLSICTALILDLSFSLLFTYIDD